MGLKSIWLIALVSLLCFNAQAQKDTLFYFAAPDVSSSVGDSPIYLRFLSYDNATNITISLPADGSFTPISINLPAQSLDSINLTPFLSSIESPLSNSVSSNGIKITADEEITCYYELRTSNSKAVFSLKGGKSLGTDFYIPGQSAFSTGATTPNSYAGFEIVASENNTTVLVTPKANIDGHSVNNSFSVVLNEGETYSARETSNAASTSISGSIVSSNKPIAITIFEGAAQTNSCTSVMGDQITSSSYIGKDYVVRKGTSSSDKIVILATQNNTSIEVFEAGSSSTTLINWGETYTYDITDTVTYVKTTKPVYNLHLTGNGCSYDMAQMPNLFCSGTYDINLTRTSSDSLAVILYTRNGFENSFTLNGLPFLNSSDFAPVPGSNGNVLVALHYLTLAEVAINSFNTISNSQDIFGMATLCGSSTNGAEYAYFSEFESYPFVTAGVDDVTCANENFAVNGVVGGGNITGFWSSTGFGTFANPTSDLTNIYVPSDLDTLVSPIEIILTSTGPCLSGKDTVVLDITPAPIVNANADQVVCANNSVVQLNGSVTGGANSGTWTTLGSGNFTPVNTDLNASYISSNADTTAGIVTLVLSSTNHTTCNVETDTMIVTITGAPFVDAGADTLYACKNNASVNINGTVSGTANTGKWTTSGNGFFSPSNLNLNASYTPSSGDVNSGQVWLYLESTNNGSCSKAKDSLVVIFTDAPLVNAGANIAACTNEASVTLNGVVSGSSITGVWTGGSGVFSSTTDLNATYTPSATEISSGSVTLTLESTNNGGCIVVTDDVLIEFVSPPLANFNFTEVCLNEETDFTDFSLPGFGSIANWNWDLGNGTSSSAINPSVTYSTAGDYNVTLIVESVVGCFDTIVQSVDVFELPTANFDYSIDCFGNNVIVDFQDQSIVNNDVVTNWFYDFGGQGSQSTQNPSQQFIGNGNFVITQVVTTSNGCIDSIVDIVSITPRPSAGFVYSSDQGLNIGATFQFSDTSSNADDYYWDFGDGNSSSDENPLNIYFENGTYEVTQLVTGDYGCSDSASVTIVINTVITEIIELIPNAISPNGDGKNDVWKLDFIELSYPDATVEVYNRWGEQVFFSDGYPFPWNGTYEGKKLPDGTYFYAIDLKTQDVIKGSLLILENRD